METIGQIVDILFTVMIVAYGAHLTFEVRKDSKRLDYLTEINNSYMKIMESFMEETDKHLTKLEDRTRKMMYPGEKP